MAKETVKFNVELTDTFGGEANYCWVKRAEMELPVGISRRALIRKAKAVLGVTYRHKPADDCGDQIRLDFAPAWMACMFISVEY